jgi:hypothetical protein
MWWRNIFAYLVAPLGAPISFTIWNKVTTESTSFIDILFSLPGLVRYATPIAYIATLLLGMPAILILSRKRCLTFPTTVIAGTLIGAITGLLIGFYIAGYDITGMVDYFNFDLMSIYVPSTIAGMVSAAIYWTILTYNFRMIRLKKE